MTLSVQVQQAHAAGADELEAWLRAHADEWEFGMVPAPGPGEFSQAGDIFTDGTSWIPPAVTRRMTMSWRFGDRNRGVILAPPKDN